MIFNLSREGEEETKALDRVKIGSEAEARAASHVVMAEVVGEAEGWTRAEGDQFLSLRYAYISNLFLLLGLGPPEKCLVVVGGW